jgi:hypothetical protein
METETQSVTRQQVIALARKMPDEKLAIWYEYGLFVQSQPLFILTQKSVNEVDADLGTEIAVWERASDEDWLKMEQLLAEEN